MRGGKTNKPYAVRLIYLETGVELTSSAQAKQIPTHRDHGNMIYTKPHLPL